MSQPGLSPENFIQRIHGVDNIADAWPYGHMPTHVKHLEENVMPLTVNTRSGARVLALTVDYAKEPRSDDERAVAVLKQFGARAQDYGSRIEAEISAVEVNAWSMLAGVRLAAKVEIDERIHHGSNTRFGVFSRILGIEQPLRTPSGNYPFYGRGSEGYIHGEITQVLGSESERAQGDHLVRLRLGKETAASTLKRRRDTTAVLRVPGGYPERNGRLKEGDVIRTRVYRHQSEPKLFYSDARLIRIVGSTHNS